MFSLYIEPVREAHATPTPGQIAARITQLTGLTPGEIDQIYAAEQAPNVLLIAYDIAIPILLEDRIGYLLIRQASTGQWIRMQVPLNEWKNDFRPYLESQGVTIHKQRYGTIDTTTPAAEAAAIAAGGSIPGSAITDLVLYGDVAGPSGSIPAAPQAAGISVPPLQDFPDIDSVGTIAGNFRVDESGAATYSVPIATAAGTAGVAPQISLNYSSSAGNGIAGQGWSIGGLSAISRCRQTSDQDKNVTSISFDANDRFCLDGQRLVRTSVQAYGALGSTYRTEIDSGAIVKVAATVNNEPDYFEVKRKDGSTSYYGKAPSSGDESAKLSGGVGRTLTWAIRSFADSVGNPIWFSYDTSGGGQRVSEIRWAYGQNRTPDSGHNAQLNFDYGPRKDKISGYIKGTLFVNDQRLTGIRSYNTAGFGTPIRDYELAYTDGSKETGILSRLESIEECAGSACLPLTTFDWRYPAFLLSTESIADILMGPTVAAFQPADINGDGLMDLVWLQGSGPIKSLRYAFSNGSGYVIQAFAGGGFNRPVTSGATDPQLRVIDYNLDGRQDVAYYNGVLGLWRIVLAEPFGDGGWRLVDTDITTPINAENVSFVDIDSNGTTDAVYTKASIYDKRVYVRPLEVDTSPGITPSSPHYYRFGDEDWIIGSGNNNTLGRIVATAGDFDGDGQVDLVMGGMLEECEDEVGGGGLCHHP